MEPQKLLEDVGEQAPTINKMQSWGPGLWWALRFPLTIESSDLIWSSHTGSSVENGSSFVFLQVGVIQAPAESNVWFLLLLLLFFFISDEELLGPRCSCGSGA